jgi:hypothetical protein
MARRPLAGRDTKIIQGHRRDEFFARMRRKGGVPRLPTQAPDVDTADEPLEATEAEPVAEAEASAEPAEA